MKQINVCIVVFNRYDLLEKLFRSIVQGSLLPTCVYLVDRGHRADLVGAAIVHSGIPAALVNVVPLEGQSLSAAWNWFMQHVSEERLLISDDIEFTHDGLARLVTTPGDFVGIEDGKSSHFAGFLIRDSCIEQVGYFDEWISPNYVYFEDCDYWRRMRLAGVPVVGSRDTMLHGLAQSWVKKTEEQQAEHHIKFVLAEKRYVQKWGGKPGEEQFATPHSMEDL